MSISSEVTYGAGRPELYRELSAAEDRATMDTGRSAMPESLPSFETDKSTASSTPEYDDYMSAVLAFDKDMFGFDEALTNEGPGSRYLLEQQGTPWPTPWTPPNYSDPTVQLLRGSIYKGWNAAAQPGAAPGMLAGLGQCGCGCGPGRPCRCGMALQGLSAAPGCGCRFAGLDSDDDLDFDLNTTASFAKTGKRLSGLEGFEATEEPASKEKRAKGMQQVLAAAAFPTTKRNREVTRKLLDQSEKVADQMEKYAKVAEKADMAAKIALKRAGFADDRSREVAKRIFDMETGDVDPDASPQDVKRMREFRREAFEAGRQAVRAQKVKLVAEGQAQNAYAQAAILQKLAATTLGGQPDAAAVYAKMFDKIGQESAALRGVRHQQKANWLAKEVRELSGDLDAVDTRVMSADIWEAELEGYEIVEDAYLGEIEGWLRRKIKKAAKKVKRRVKKVAKRVKRAAKKAGKPISFISRRAAAIAKKASQKVARAAVRSAKRAGQVAARAAAKAARKIKNSTVAKNFMKVAGPVAKSLRSVAKVAVEPVRMSYQATKRTVRGDFKGAFNAVKNSAKRTMKGLTDVVRHGVFGVACGIENTRLGRAAGQAVGQAVGTIYGGGTAGGAVGREAGRKANDINRGMCKGMKQLGLTGEQKLSLSARNLKKSLKVTARDLKRTTFSKKAMMASAMRIAGGMLGGGVGGGAASTLANFGTKQFTNFGVKALKDQGTKFLKKKGAQLLRRKGSQLVGKLARKSGIPGSKLVATAASAYVRGRTPRLTRGSVVSLAKRGSRSRLTTLAKQRSRARLVGLARQQSRARARRAIPSSARALLRFV